MIGFSRISRMVVVLLVVFGCVVGAALAQNGGVDRRHVRIKGVVVDKNNSLPMAGVTIIANDGEGAVTNRKGEYVINTVRECKGIEYSFLGYKTYVIDSEITTDTTLNVELVPRSMDVEQVVVSGNSTGVATKYGRVIVKANQLKYTPIFMGEQDIFKYLQTMPGVSGGKEGGSDINIRGGSADQTLVTLDDVPVYNQNHALGYVSIFNGSTLDGAELYKGAIPAHLGGRLSGAVDVSLKEGSRDRHSQTIGIGLITAVGMVEGPINKGKGSYMVAGRYFVPSLGLMIRDNNKKDNALSLLYDFYDITAKFAYDINSRNSLSLSMYHGYDNFRYVTGMTKGPNPFDEQVYIDGGGVGVRWMTNLAVVKHNFKISDKLTLTNSAYYSGMNNDTRNIYERYLPPVYTDVNGVKSNINDFGISSSLRQMAGRHTLNYAIQASFVEMRPKIQYSLDMFGNRTKDQQIGYFNLSTVAFSVNDVVTFDRWSLSAGLRIPVYFNNVNSNVQFEPRLGVSFDVSQKNTLFASYDRLTQPIFSLNRQMGGQSIDFWLPVRDDVMQSSNQIAVGWKFRPTSRFLFSLEAFGKSLHNVYYVYNENELILDVGGYNVGNGYSVGGELVAQYVAPKTTVTLSYTHSISRRFQDGEWHRFKYDVPYNLNLYVKQQTFKRGDREHNASINLMFKAGMPYILSDNMIPPLSGIGSSLPSEFLPANPLYPNASLDNYFRLDINYSMEKKIGKGSRTWQISIINTTNYFNPTYVYKLGNSYRALAILPIMPSFMYKRTF